MAQLPGDDALAIFLADAGASRSVIAERLSIDSESVEPLLEVARHKLTRLLQVDRRFGVAGEIPAASAPIPQ